MLGHHAFCELAISEVGSPSTDTEGPAVLSIGRFASRSFTTRITDAPASEFIAGRVNGGLRIERDIQVNQDGYFGPLFQVSFGEIELNNADGGLDNLVDQFFADGREVRVKIGRTEIETRSRIRPQFVASPASVSSGDSSTPWVATYPSSGVIPGDFFLLPITINDPSSAGDLDGAPPAPWQVLAESSNNELYQAILYHVATGTEAGTTSSIEWSSSGGEDVIVGRIRQFRYVDPADPVEGLTSAITGNLTSINLPSVTTTTKNTLAVFVLSMSDNASTAGPQGESGGDWNYNAGDPASSTTGNDAADRVGTAAMGDSGTISGGSISITATDSPLFSRSVLRGFALKGLPTAGGAERVQPLSSFATVYAAGAGDWYFEKDIVRLRVIGMQARLHDQIQTSVYSGVGGANGTADLTGITKPLTFGRCFNVRGQVVDPFLSTIQLHSGPISDVISVYERGVQLNLDGGGDFSTYENLASATVDAGMYITCLAEGFIRVGAVVDPSAVTVDLDGALEFGGGHPTRHGNIMLLILQEYSNLENSEIDLVSFNTLQSIDTARIGIYLPPGDQSTIVEVLSRIALSCGAMIGEDGSGQYRTFRLDPPSATASREFDARNIIAIQRERLPYVVPFKSWGVAYARNWTVQTESDLALEVTQSRRQFLAEQNRWVYAQSEAITEAHLTSRGVRLEDALYESSAPALTEAERRLELYGLGQAMYRVVVKDALFQVRLGETVRLRYDRWNLAGGRNFTVIGLGDDADSRETTIIAFGGGS